MTEPFRRFYEELLAMASEGVPAAMIVQKVRRAVPEAESRKQLIGHLRDSRDAFEAEGKEGPAATLGHVIESLDRPDDA